MTLVHFCTQSFFVEFIQVNWDETILVVNVTDVNDNAPYFPEGRDFTGILTIAPDAKSGQTIGSVKAIDPDVTSVLQYSIVANPNDDSDKFSINSQNGLITATRNFDQLSASEFRFTVFVTDGLFNTTTPVVVSYYKRNLIGIFVQKFVCN